MLHTTYSILQEAVQVPEQKCEQVEKEECYQVPRQVINPIIVSPHSQLLGAAGC